MMTDLAFQGLIHMIHPSSLGQRLKGRKRQALNLNVGFLGEVVLKCQVDLPCTHRPADHANLILTEARWFR